MIGRSFAERDYQVWFATSPVNWSALLRRGDQFGFSKVVSLITSGIRDTYKTGAVLNFSTLSLRLPGFLGRMFSGMSQAFENRAMSKLVKKAARLCPNPEYVVIESIPMVSKYLEIKSAFPNSRFVYRPSDPIFPRPEVPDELRKHELAVVKDCDALLAVNQMALELYKGEVSTRSEMQVSGVLPNGFDADAYRKDWEEPSEITCLRQDGKRLVVSYVGASAPYWEALVRLGETNQNLGVMIICPVPIPRNILARIQANPRISVIPGVEPSRVPSYVKNSDIIAVPYPPECADWWRGPHSKLYQAMAAKKPVVALNLGLGIDNPEIEQYSTIDDFIFAFEKYNSADARDYSFDLSELDWSRFGDRLFNYLHKLNANHCPTNSSD